MSESSDPTSSQLDDIELAEPCTKRYEHHTDVGYMFGEEKQQWSLPVMPARDSPGAQSSSIKGTEFSVLSASAIEDRSHHGDSMARLREQDDGRLEHAPTQQSGAPHMHTRRRVSEARSDTSEDACMRVAESSCSHTVTVDVLSTAFTLNQQAWQQGYQLGHSPAEIISRRACTGLGIDQSSLRYYELREVPVCQLRSSGHYAVAIERSGMLWPLCALYSRPE